MRQPPRMGRARVFRDLTREPRLKFLLLERRDILLRFRIGHLLFLALLGFTINTPSGHFLSKTS